MNTCKGCKHWGPDYKCLNSHLDSLLIADAGDWMMIVSDAGKRDDASVYMVTGPDFGCIHWERKP